jgi:hypothetical protein
LVEFLKSNKFAPSIDVTGNHWALTMTSWFPSQVTFTRSFVAEYLINVEIWKEK